MNNNWEYDYSELYHNNSANAPQQYSAGQGTPYEVPGPQKRGGGFKRVLACVLLVVFCFAAGYGGSYWGNVQAAKLAAEQQPGSSAPSDAGSSSGADSGAAASHPTAPAVHTGAMTTEEIAAKVRPSVVEVTTEHIVTSDYYFFGGQYVQSGAGSGVIISEDGYIITNNHVVSGASNVKVLLTDGSEYEAVVVGADSRSDIAVIKIEATGLSPAVIGDSDTLQVGEYAMAVGNPLGNFGGSVTDGIISGLNRSINVDSNTMQVLQTNAAISPGNSGGGLFNASGELIGIVNAKSADTDAEGLGFAIPVNTAISVAKDLIENGYVSGRPQMGVMVVSIENAQTAYKYGVNQLGVYVQSVNKGGAADVAGLQPGDRFISIDNTVINTSSDVTGVLDQHAVGDTINIQIARGSQIISITLTLEEAKPSAAAEEEQNSQSEAQPDLGFGSWTWPTR